MGGYLSQGSVLGSAPVKQRGGKTRTEARQQPAQKGRQGQQNRTGKQNHRHRTQKATQGTAEKRKQEQSFLSQVSCAVLGTAPLFYTPAVFRPWGRNSSVADCPLASADTSGPVTRVLELLEIVDELVDTVECPFLIAGSLDRWIAGSTGRGVDTVAGGCVD